MAFEPSETNRLVLERHVQWNRLGTIKVVPVALSDTDGESGFGGSASSIAFRLGGGDEVVKTRTIRSLVEHDGLELPDVMKIDAEGSEASILRGGKGYLTPGMLIWISIHSRELLEECREILASGGFEMFESAKMARRMNVSGGRWGGDTELLAVGKARGLSSADLKELQLFRR